MASALALQCSTSRAMKTHMELAADQFIEFIFTRDRNEGSRDRNEDNEESVAFKVLIITDGLWRSVLVDLK